MFLEEFLPLKGATFLADCDPKPAALELFDVIPGRYSAGLVRPSFNLLFRSEPDVLLVTGLYKIRSGAFGPEIVYIEPTMAPTGPDAPAGYYYQSVFC